MLRSSVLVLFFVTHGAVAAPCCSSNAAAPSIISGDDDAQITFSASRSTVIGDAPDHGRAVFRSANDSEISQSYRIDAVKVLADRYQAGISVPLTTREVSRPSTSAKATRFGDLRFTASYEVLPEWSYSAWKPKGFVFFQTTLPTGRSLYDAQETGAVDATGRGFYSLALGALFVKAWGAWDIYSVPEIHHAFLRTFDGTGGSEPLTVSPRWGGSLALGAGFSPNLGNLRLGIRVQPTTSQGKIVRSSAGETVSGGQVTWDISFEASYLLNEAWILLASYTDQTLLGPARNSTLSRTFSMGFQRRWAR